MLPVKLKSNRKVFIIWEKGSTKQKRDKKNVNNIGLFVFMETTQIDTTIELK